MSLMGKYGEQPKRAAERMLEEGAYDAACSDAHRPEDIDVMARAIERLKKLVGKEEADALLGSNARQILEGTYAP
jgi:protein-tyrosine phosphatase